MIADDETLRMQILRRAFDAGGEISLQAVSDAMGITVYRASRLVLQLRDSGLANAEGLDRVHLTPGGVQFVREHPDATPE